MAPVTRVLYWFRTDLRLHDSPAMHASLSLKPAEFYPVWCWDPHYVYNQTVGPNRWQFLLDSMQDVSNSIKSINPKSQLFVVRGSPMTILPALCKEWKITDIFWEKDDDAYTAERDQNVSSILAPLGVQVHSILGHTLYDAAKIKEISPKQICPSSYGAFLKLIDKLPKPDPPIPAPLSIPNPGPVVSFNGSWDRNQHHSVKEHRARDVNYPYRVIPKTDRDHSYETFSGPNGDFSVPTMEELGFIATSSVRGGETRALQVLRDYMKDKVKVATFKKPQTSPAQFDPPSTTQLSPHLKFGTLSARLFYHQVMDINKSVKIHSSPPESLIGQLLWREFFHANQFSTPNFSQIRGNPLCRFIGWRLQNQYDSPGALLSKKASEEVWQRDDPDGWELFQAWKFGQTGFPWIDALMRQLRLDGWLHHLGRHSVACFLTRGQLYISWERGAEVFDEFLVDWDPALNSGNWMWLSASAFFSQYFRVYSPATYGQKSDSTGALIRKYCPELAKLPDKFIYEPWKAPEAVLKKAQVVLGKTYPKRIVDANEAKDNALRLLKLAYTADMKGNDPCVLNGGADAKLREGMSGETTPGKRKMGDLKDDFKASPAKKIKGEAMQTTLKF